MKTSIFVVLVTILSAPFVCAGQLSILHRSSTSPGNFEGRIVGTSVDGTDIYGFTDTGNGVNVFSLDTVTGAFALISLPTQSNQWILPPQKAGTIAKIGDQLFGSFSPDNSDVFSVRTDGSDFRVIANAVDVGLQFPNVIAAAGRVFGSAERGVFSVNPDGTDLRLFPGNIESPTSAPLAFDGQRVYGATWDSFGFSPAEVVTGVGKIFSVNPDGSDFQTLRDTGPTPITSITVQDGRIYGLEDTFEGTRVGPDGLLPGRLFTMNTDGSEYRVLHEFEDGQNASRVVSNGDELFGVTRTGGSENAGTIFRSDLDGDNYEILHNFGAGPLNGAFPNSDLVVVGSNLYGSTTEGGSFDPTDALSGGGIVYSLAIDSNAVPEPTSLAVWLTLIAVAASAKYRSLGPAT